MSDWISVIAALSGALVGGITTYLSENHSRKSDTKERIKRYSSLLYYDLQSIEQYLRSEKSLVDIRYFQDWQKIMAECSLLQDEFGYLYKIYDNIYNYDFHFKQSLNRGESFAKENIPEYKILQTLIFDSDGRKINFNLENREFKQILSDLRVKTGQ